MSPAIREAARAVVLDDRDRIVLVHWVNEDNAVDLWLTPGGGVDDGEDREAALRRELREELGLEEFEPARWWTLTELEHSTEAFAPVRIADLLRELLASGPPPDPIAAGV